jgi:hypothetical protein
LLTTEGLSLTDKEYYYFGNLPENYMQWKRVDVYAKKDCCDKRRMTVYLAEEENLNQLLRDNQKRPSFEWAETFATLIGNTTHIYTNDEFDIESANLIYYRQPRRIQITDCTNPYDNTISTTNVECEFKDDIVEIIIDEAASIIAGDIESGNQFSRGTETAERNN